MLQKKKKQPIFLPSVVLKIVNTQHVAHSGVDNRSVSAAGCTGRTEVATFSLAVPRQLMDVIRAHTGSCHGQSHMNASQCKKHLVHLCGCFGLHQPGLEGNPGDGEGREGRGGGLKTLQGAERVNQSDGGGRCLSSKLFVMSHNMTSTRSGV